MSPTYCRLSLMSKRSPVAVVALMGILILSGCAPVAEPRPSATPTIAPSPSPEATRQQETGLTRPSAVFGGDCSAVLDPTELSAALGVPIELQSPSVEPRELSPVFTFVEQAGGLDCSWSSSDHGSAVVISVVPAASVTIPIASGCGNFLESGAFGCQLDATSNGIRMTGLVSHHGASEVELAPVAREIIEKFEERAATTVPGRVPIPADGAWPMRVDCDALIAAIDFSALLGSDYAGGYSGGNDAYMTPADAALRGNTTAYCGAYSPTSNEGIYFSMLGGGRWNEQLAAAAADTTTVAVPGVERVVLRPAYDSTYVEVFNGPNWFQTSSDDPDAVYPIILAIVAYLDDLAG
jgi:hypothetical protein